MAPKNSTPSPNKQLILDATQAYRAEAEEARRDRLARNRLNWNVYYGNIDFSYKQEGQSAEHLPKLAIASEQVRAFVKKALVSFGDWYQVKTGAQYPLTPEQIRALMNRFLDKVVVARNTFQPIETIIANAVMQGLLESLIVLKVHGGLQGEKVFKVEPGEPLAGLPPRLHVEGTNLWRLRVDIIPTEDYFPDPTGRGLYKLHRVERDFIDVLEMAEAGLYDMRVVNMLDDDYSREAAHDKTRNARQRNQNEAKKPRNRRRVVLTEGWGTILGPDGRPVHKDVVWCVANDKYVIRAPEPFPFWHGEDPFVVAPLLQNPHTVWSKALYDDVASLNIAIDELYNLILDGGLASVWGVRQVRENWLVDPRQISGGIPQNATLAVNDEAPVDGKVVEVVASGKVPPEAMGVLQLTVQEANAAGLMNDLRVGTLPGKNVKATEVMSADQSSNTMMDSLTSELERNIISPLLHKSWFTILQFADDLPAEDVAEALGTNAAFMLSRLAPAERYAALARAEFKVIGLSGTITKARDFQKFMAMMQATAMNPILMQAFVTKMSPEKALTAMYRMLNLNPSDFEMSEEEMQQVPDRVLQMAVLNNLVGGKGGGAGKSQSPDGMDRSQPNEARAQASGHVEGEANYGST